MIHPFSRYAPLDRAIAARSVQADERECLECFESCARHDPMVDATKKDQSFFCMKDTTGTLDQYGRWNR